MKNKKNINPFFRLFSIVIILVLVTIITGIGLFYYIFAIPEPEGLSLASWTNTFTNNFSAWLVGENGEITVANKGIDYLEEYGLWLQVVDENGQEVFAYQNQTKPQQKDLPIKHQQDHQKHQNMFSLEKYAEQVLVRLSNAPQHRLYHQTLQQQL